VLGIDTHGAELIDRERLAAQILFTPMVLHGIERLSPVEPNPSLGIENRAAGREPDQ
jgi:hypothetical protein